MRLIVPLVLCVAPVSVAAQSTRATADSVAIVTARTLVLDTRALLGAPGASIAVIRAGRLIWSEGFGYADLEQRVPVTPLTRFRIGSVSKPLTSIALGVLVEEGKLDLDAPVQRYLPEFPVKQWPITTRQLAGHLAGIRHYRGDEFASARHYDTVLDGLVIFADDSLLFEPETQYSYSTYGWNLISAIIERAGGESFLSYMASRVFGPAGMTRTVPEFNDSLIPFRAHFYVHADSAAPARNAPYVDNSYKWAGGGFLSTPEDLARFGRKLLEGKLLRPATRDLLWASQHTRDGKATDYGMGWRSGRDAEGRSWVGHTGGAMGGTANLVIYPDQQLVIALLVNSDRTFISAAPRLAALFMR